MNKLKQLDNKDDFARLLGFKNSSYINYILYNIGTDNLYRVFSIPKKNGEVRLIHAPKPELKLLQKKLANVLWDCFVGVKFQYYCGKGGTDAGAAHLKNHGVPSTTIGVCARYIHSHQTLYSMDDFLEAQAFLQAIVKKLDCSTVDLIKNY